MPVFQVQIVKDGSGEMADYDSRTKLEALRDHFETFGRGGNYLLIGHGAGFVSCLSVFKDHPETLPSQFPGIGLLILLFGSGLLLSSLFWATSMMIKINVTQLIISQGGHTKTWRSWLLGRLLQLLAHIGLWGSMIVFALAIIFIMSQFADAIPPELLGWWQLLP
jgi:hypothetical protein